MAPIMTNSVFGADAHRALSRRARRGRPCPHLRGAHVRLPDERPRLGAALRLPRERRLRPAELGEEADVVVINTCAVRDNAAGKLYGTLGHLKSRKDKHEGMQIAVGGCLAQMDKDAVLDKAPWVDVVFGTHNMGSLPSLLERARHNGEAELEILESLEIFPSTLPTKRDSVYSGWVSISVGCNNTCTFCIVPSLRGKEKDRRPGDILNEIRLLVDDGAIEVTLLGQNVNSYGVEFGDRQAFGKLLRAAGEIDGPRAHPLHEPASGRLHRRRHRRDGRDARPSCRSCTCRCSPGSDRILKAMRRSYRSERFLGILDRVRERMPHAAITTDIIVGFPGETDEDFEDTMRVVEQARFSSAFTFQYSIREGTPAATMPDQVPKAVVQERYERLIALQERISHEENQKQVGRELQVLVSMGEGKKDAATHRLTGRAEDNRLVHFEVPAGSDLPRPGDVVSVVVTHAAPFHLLADAPDGAPLRIRRTRAGDAWDRTQAESCGIAGTGGGDVRGAAKAVSLGLPTLRVGV